MGKRVLRKKEFFRALFPFYGVDSWAQTQFAGIFTPFVLSFVPFVGKGFTIL